MCMGRIEEIRNQGRFTRIAVGGGARLWIPALAGIGAGRAD